MKQFDCEVSNKHSNLNEAEKISRREEQEESDVTSR